MAGAHDGSSEPAPQAGGGGKPAAVTVCGGTGGPAGAGNVVGWLDCGETGCVAAMTGGGSGSAAVE